VFEIIHDGREVPACLGLEFKRKSFKTLIGS